MVIPTCLCSVQCISVQCVCSSVLSVQCVSVYSSVHWCAVQCVAVCSSVFIMYLLCVALCTGYVYQCAVYISVPMLWFCSSPAVKVCSHAPSWSSQPKSRGPRHHVLIILPSNCVRKHNVETFLRRGGGFRIVSWL